MDTLKLGSYGIVIPISILPDTINKREYSNKLCKIVKDKHIKKEFNFYVSINENLYMLLFRKHFFLNS